MVNSNDYYKTVMREEGLVMLVYYFCMANRSVTMTRACKLSRPSRKHRWRTEAEWLRYGIPGPIPAMDKPVVPEDVIAEVRKDLHELPIVV